MSVVSVPFDDGAIGEGSATSLALETRGDECAGGWREFEWSEGLARQLGGPHKLLSKDDHGETYRLATTGDMKGFGEVGESV